MCESCTKANGNTNSFNNRTFTIDNVKRSHQDEEIECTCVPYSDYRYGFNGMEKDNEVKGKGNSYDFGARMYDSRLGRWLSVDLAFSEYSSIAPYVYCGNSSIVFVDPDGKRFYFAAGAGNDAIKHANYAELFGLELEKAGIKNFVGINGGHKSDHNGFGLAKPVHTWNESMTSMSSAGKLPLSQIKQADNRYLKSFSKKVDNAISEIVTDLKSNPLKDGEQFNLSGYSYGTVLMAQASIRMLENGDVDHIDNLILIGSTIDPESQLGQKLAKLEKEGKIGNVVYKQVENDEVVGVASKENRLFRLLLTVKTIFAGATGNYDEGHLKFSGDKNQKASNNERNKIANELKDEGIK